MSDTRNKLLSITNLKKYFPLAKKNIFQKKRLYVRANEEITIDIYEGETFGLVGESGCGKSTLGRVLLQLYDQTAGTTMYYGRKRSEIAPKYVKDTIVNAGKYIEKWRKQVAKAEELSKKCEELGVNATSYDLQEKNLALAEADTELRHIASILGGFIIINDEKARKLLLDEYEAEYKLAKMYKDYNELQLNIREAQIRLDNAGDNVKDTKKYGAHYSKYIGLADSLRKSIEASEAHVSQIKENISQVRNKYADNAEFMKYENMLDDGIDLARLKYNEMRTLRKDLQIIFQDPYSSLDPRMTVGNIIEEGLLTHNMFKKNSPNKQEYIMKVMRNCGLQDYMVHRFPHQFSGGQRQRICIARALAVNPKFVVCDECVSALDVSIQSQIINLLEELKEKENLTYLFISHDLSVVRYISDRIAVMYLGNIVELTDSETMFRDPRHPYTIALLSSVPTTDPNDLDKERIILEGNIPSPIFPPSGCKFHTRCYMACEDCKRVPPPLVEVEPGHYVACHKLEKKVDENGNYLFELPKMERKSTRI